MKPMPAFTGWTLLGLLLVLLGAAAARGWYLLACADRGEQEPALLVQGRSRLLSVEAGQRVRARTPPRELDNLAANVADLREFRGLAPLSNQEEPTAHVAPGYPWLCGAIASLTDRPDFVLRWLQAGLGVLTAGCYFFFARRAFHSTILATLTGLLIAFYPFWIVNTAELRDGVVASFLLGLCLMLGTRGSQQGGAGTSLLFGVALAALTLVRAALLPFALAALLWFLWRSRRASVGWLAGFLALFGFVNGVAPWIVRDYLLFDRPVPIATSSYLHLWIGNNPRANGAGMSEKALRASLGDQRVGELLDEPNQARRYDLLARDLRHEIEQHPRAVVGHRLDSLLAFVLGRNWFTSHRLSATQEGEGIAAAPAWVADGAEAILQGTLLALLLLALLGWRLSHPWRRESRLAALAALWMPLPYILSHAESLHGPRLPLDGVLLCFAAFALAKLVPGVVGSPDAGPINPKPRAQTAGA